ncbi:hypothetical protein [Caldalkalibacillus mannanilyticus]|nr:hypothetical protein [Caldalkalibacillus mannanilyticus]
MQPFTKITLSVDIQYKDRVRQLLEEQFFATSIPMSPIKIDTSKLGKD